MKPVSKAKIEDIIELMNLPDKRLRSMIRQMVADERLRIIYALMYTDRVEDAAAFLGMNERTFYRRRNKYGIRALYRSPDLKTQS